jgi:HAD superfamily hydrolase (TIGR01509 family)
MSTDTHIRAVVFDMDGVLVDSAVCHRTAFEQTFLPFGVTGFDYGRYAGWRTPEVVRDVLTGVVPDLTDESIDQIAGRKSQIARDLMTATDRTVPGCTAVLERLAECYMLALASSGSRQSVELFLTKIGGRKLFRSVLCGDQVQRAKPDPEIYERTFEMLGIEPRYAIVVEDAVSGIEAAIAAGAHEVIGVVGTVPPDALVTAGARRVVSTLSELPELICPKYESQSAG